MKFVRNHYNENILIKNDNVDFIKKKNDKICAWLKVLFYFILGVKIIFQLKVS